MNIEEILLAVLMIELIVGIIYSLALTVITFSEVVNMLSLRGWIYEIVNMLFCFSIYYISAEAIDAYILDVYILDAYILAIIWVPFELVVYPYIKWRAYVQAVQKKFAQQGFDISFWETAQRIKDERNYFIDIFIWPSSRMFEKMLEKKKAEEAGKQELENEWECTFCKRMNSGSVDVCQCGKTNVKKLALNEEEGGWQCSECGRLNPKYSGTCACGHDRDAK